MMVKEYWFEEIRKSVRRIKVGKLSLGQLLEEKRVLDLYIDNLIRVSGDKIGMEVDTILPEAVGFFKRLILWFKSFRSVLKGI